MNETLTNTAETKRVLTTSHLATLWLAGALFAAGTASLRAADWPQWRGPNRDGVASESPKLADDWPKAGPPKVWQSDPLRGGSIAGWSSPVVAGGKVYIYSSGQWKMPFTTRTLAEQTLREMGWFPENAKPPQELIEKIEKARAGEDRAAVMSKDVGEWIKDMPMPSMKTAPSA